VEYLETFIGGLRAGACVVPLSTMAAADALEKMLDDCDAKVLFLSDQYRSLVEPYENRLGKLIKGGRIAYDFKRGSLRRARRRSRCRSPSSMTSTSSIARARPDCPKASCTAM
jgi:acyl-CoA synthetase (AMP-forming)/AMP-acid ligase II